MKYFKFMLLLLIVSTFFKINLYAQSAIPENIRVGLYYLDSAVDSVDISSDTGLDIGTEIDGNYKYFLKDSSLNSATIIKDNYNADGKSMAAYHIELGNALFNYTSASNLAEKFIEQGYSAYPAYDGRWKVWVGIYKSKYSANIDVGKLSGAIPDYTYSIIEPSSKRIQVLDKKKNVILIFEGIENHLIIKPILKDGYYDVISINGKKYRGNAEIIRTEKSDMTVVNLVNLEEYLYSTVSSEMPNKWHIEALKAQAVTARTYAVSALAGGSKTKVYNEIGFDITPTIEFQVYKGFIEETDSTRQAVDETKGELIYYNNSPINAVFFSSSGGITENSENVWSAVVPYLRAIDDKYQPEDRSNKSWEYSVTPQEIKDYYAKKDIDIGDIVDVRVESYSKSHNSIMMKVIGTKGEWKYEKSDARAFMGGGHLLSQTFTVDKAGSPSLKVLSSRLKKMQINLEGKKVISKTGTTTIDKEKPIYVKSKTGTRTITSKPTSFVFKGSGYGHGVGMSQWGAKGMAEAGFKYDEILKHYFTGVEIK